MPCEVAEAMLRRVDVSEPRASGMPAGGVVKKLTSVLASSDG